MAFCKQCGTDLQGAKFCPSCGAAAEGEIVLRQGMSGAYPTTQIIRQQTLEELQQLTDHFGSKAELYTELDEVEKKVEAGKNTPFGKLVMIVIGAIFLIITIGIVISGISSGISMAISEDGLVNILLHILIRIVLAAVVPGIIAFLLLSHGIKGFKKNKKQYEEEYSALLVRKDWLTKELQTNYNNYGVCPIAYEYTHPSVLNIIANYIRSGRANTITDAVNMLHDEIYKQEMLEKAEETRIAAVTAAQQASEANSKAGWGAAASTINLFKK